MKKTFPCPPCYALAVTAVALALTGSMYAANPPIPFSEIGAKATADYQGDALAITPTPDGALLRCAFQKLNGRATAEGLWLESTIPGGGRFRLTAAAMGREKASGPACTALAVTGRVVVADKLVRFTRPGVIEEYSVSVDGVRQDFVIGERPAGVGDLQVELALSGARAESAGRGASLVLEGSGRALAYSRLRATDATGKELTARLDVLSASRLAVRVTDANATYPVRIDPTFSDANWVSLGAFPGANGNVSAAAVDDSGNLYIGGGFPQAGGLTVNYVARWNGSSWSAVGPGLNSTVNALAVSEGTLYAGGAFTTAGGSAANYIAQWDGTNWSALGSGLGGSSPSVSALAVSGGTLYAGGDFTTPGTNVSAYTAEAILGSAIQNIGVAGGMATMSCQGVPGATYAVQRATDALLTQNLTTVLTTNAPANGLFLFTDPNPPSPAAFYRMLQQ